MKNVNLTVEIVEAIEALPADLRAEIYSMIFAYAFSGVLPTAPSPTAKGFFLLVKPHIDRQIRRSQSKNATATPVANDRTAENIETLFRQDDRLHHIDNTIKPKLQPSKLSVENYRLLIESAHRAGALRAIANRNFDHWVQFLPQRLDEHLRTLVST